jgi:hypothetical protein
MLRNAATGSACASSLENKMFHAKSAFLPNARVVKWQTRTFEGRMPQGVGVQVPPRAQEKI